jgi:hypothetical protein
MLICKYYSEGSSIAHISYLLGRPRAVVEEILKEDKARCLSHDVCLRHNDVRLRAHDVLPDGRMMRSLRRT